MSKWLLSVIGVVFIGVLFDILYPNGKTNKLCKSIFGIFATFIMISPIFNVDINSVFEGVVEDSVLLENINQAKEDTYKRMIESHLNDVGIVGVSVEIDGYLDYSEFVIKNVYVDTVNLVLTENITNINKYEVIANEVVSVVEIPSERIIVYG